VIETNVREIEESCGNKAKSAHTLELLMALGLEGVFIIKYIISNLALSRSQLDDRFLTVENSFFFFFFFGFFQFNLCKNESMISMPMLLSLLLQLPNLLLLELPNHHLHRDQSLVLNLQPCGNLPPSLVNNFPIKTKYLTISYIYVVLFLLLQDHHLPILIQMSRNTSLSTTAMRSSWRSRSSLPRRWFSKNHWI
jgi:hypothetical protein